MNLELKKHITTYFNQVFIEGVRSFEQLIINFTSSSRIKNNFKIQLSNVVRDNKNDFKPKQANQLLFGKNENAEVSFYVLRVIWNSFYTFIFSASRLPIKEVDDLFCIIVETPEMEGPFSEAWKKQLGPMSTLLIKEPALEQQVFSNIKIVRVLIENIFIKKPSIFRADPNEIKTKGNQYFKNGDYISALNYYEYSLACSFVQSQSDINFRAILYSNSAATLFKLNFYDCSLVYCSISNFLEKEYIKVNVWKIKCLLQKKMFGEIPNLLVVLQKSNADYFTTVNSKFAIYLSNSLSMYNWKAVCQQIMKRDQQQINIADYMSKSVGVMIFNEKEKYYALENIKKDSILIIKKPVILEKKGSKITEKLSDKIVKLLKLQKSSNHYNIRNVWSQYQSFESNTQVNTQKQIHKIFNQLVTGVRDITSNQSQSLGYWPEILKFSHGCQPNCSYAHFESILIASTCSNIEKGQLLTIDYALEQSPEMRRVYLQNSHGIVCNCEYCQKGLLYTKNAKQDFWNIITSAYGQIEASLLESESQKFQDNINWNDLVIAFRLFRQGIKFQNILMKILQRGLRNLLKIPEASAKQLIDILK